MMKRLLVLALCVCMMLSCTGCASQWKEQAVAESSGASVPETDASEEAVVVTEEEEIVVDELVPVEDLQMNDEIGDADWKNILLLGGDSRGKNDYGRTDAIIILSVNMNEGGAKMTSIMRDTWVRLPEKGGQKLNSANVYGGPQLVMRTINENFGMNISDYVLVNMQALAEIIDALGGVEVPQVTKAQRKALNQQMKYDAKDFKLANSAPLEEYGENITLTGNQALAFARIRNLDSDFKRTERQRTVLIAMAQKLKNMGATTAIGLIPTLLEHVETNMGMKELVELASMGMQLDMNAVAQLRLPAEGAYEDGEIDGVWKIVPDFPANAKILYDFIYGEPQPTVEPTEEAAE